MPKKINLYDRGEPSENTPAQILQRFPVDAEEAIDRDPARYSLTRPSPWPPANVALAPQENRGAAAEVPPKRRAGATDQAQGDREAVERRHSRAGEKLETALPQRGNPGLTGAEGPAVKPGEDPFLQVKGIGAGLARKLRASGVNTFADLASKTPEQLAEIASTPGKTPKVIRDAQWIENARALAATPEAGNLPAPETVVTE